ncbi:hypothetical protein ACSSS7_007086 [Eimeria intestinalis]
MAAAAAIAFRLCITITVSCGPATVAAAAAAAALGGDAGEESASPARTSSSSSASQQQQEETQRSGTGVLQSVMSTAKDLTSRSLSNVSQAVRSSSGAVTDGGVFERARESLSSVHDIAGVAAAAALVAPRFSCKALFFFPVLRLVVFNLMLWREQSNSRISSGIAGARFVFALCVRRVSPAYGGSDGLAAASRGAPSSLWRRRPCEAKGGGAREVPLMFAAAQRPATAVSFGAACHLVS